MTPHISTSEFLMNQNDALTFMVYFLCPATAIQAQVNTAVSTELQILQTEEIWYVVDS